MSNTHFDQHEQLKTWPLTDAKHQYTTKKHLKKVPHFDQHEKLRTWPLMDAMHQCTTDKHLKNMQAKDSRVSQMSRFLDILEDPLYVSAQAYSAIWYSRLPLNPYLS